MRFLPLLTALTFLAPLPAGAEGIPAVSHYTQRVLERAQAALSAEQSPGGDTWQTDNKIEWVKNTVSQVLGARKSETTRTAEGERLPRETACLRADLLLLEQEMEKIRGLLWEAYQRQSMGDIFRFGEIYAFLDRRRNALSWGALRPGYADTDWSLPMTFETEEEQKRIKEERLCPFNTKYFDVSLNQAYGCTPDALNEALAALTEVSSDFDEAVNGIGAERLSLQTFIEKLLQDQPSGARQENKPPQVEGCVEEWPPDFHAWSPGRFQEVPGERFLSLLRVLWNLEILRPSAYQPTTFSIQALGLSMMNPELARQAQVFSIGQMEKDSVIRGAVVESRGVEDAFSPLTRAVGKLSRLAHDFGGSGESRSLRDFTMDLAFFLRRSCMSRECNAALERVIKIINAESCFPYTNGDAEVDPKATEEERKKKIAELIAKCMAEAKVDRL